MRVILAEDEALLREGLCLLLERNGFDVVAAVGTADGLLDAVEEHHPDLVATDIRMPPTHTDDGLQAALEIRRRWPATALVLLSQHVERRYALQLLAHPTAGTGYLLKQRVTDSAAFCDDLRRVGNGATVLDPEVAQLMVTRARGTNSAIEGLSRRQREVLELVAQGRSNAWIAHRLSVTEKAVVNHVSHIYDQLGLLPGPDDHRRVLAVVQYLSR